MTKYIAGHRGQLGSIFAKIYPKAYMDYDDLTSRWGSRTWLSDLTSDDVVFFCAAMTDVDYCEEHPDESYAMNVTAVKHVSEIVAAANATLVFFSSDYVFDGVRGLYTVKDSVNPINVYGTHKVFAENYIQQHVEKHYIIRTNMIFGHDDKGKNFTSRLFARIKSMNDWMAPNDEWVTPTYNVNLAGVTTCLVDSKEPYGIVHAVGETLTNRYEFSHRFAVASNLDERMIKPCKSDSFKRKARRPLNGGLTATHSCGKLDDALKDMISEKDKENDDSIS